MSYGPQCSLVVYEPVVNQAIAAGGALPELHRRPLWDADARHGDVGRWRMAA
jgi:hypothetical protein